MGTSKKTTKRPHESIKLVSYVSEIREYRDYKDPVISQYPLMMNHTRRYHNCLHLLAGLNPCARDLMDYLAENMDDNNIVRNDYIVRNSFIKFVEKLTKGKTGYKEETVKKSFGKLKAKTLLIQKGNGIFMVNPEYFVRNSDKNRLDLVKEMLTYKPDKKTLIDEKHTKTATGEKISFD